MVLTAPASQRRMSPTWASEVTMGSKWMTTGRRSFFKKSRSMSSMSS